MLHTHVFIMKCETVDAPLDVNVYSKKVNVFCYLFYVSIINSNNYINYHKTLCQSLKLLFQH